MINEYDKVILCPYCSMQILTSNDEYVRTKYCSFLSSNVISSSGFLSGKTNCDEIKITQILCHNCNKYSIKITGQGDFVKGKQMMFVPSSSAIQFPDYIPKKIKEDYEEANSILQLSPKASATLSRRCLQGIIQDVFKTKENSLYHQIDEIKNQIDPKLWKAIDALRKIGNIGAHMQKDVNTIVPDIIQDEASKLLKLIEILIKEWYVNPYERNLLLNEIVEISDNKQNKHND